MVAVSTRSPKRAQRAGESLDHVDDGPTGIVPKWWNGPTGVAPHTDADVQELRVEVAELRALGAPGRRPLDLEHVPLAGVVTKREDLDNWKAGRRTVEIVARAAMVYDGAIGKRVVNRPAKRHLQERAPRQP